MTPTNDTARVRLFPLCDRDGLLLTALSSTEESPAARADATLFGWMLGLEAGVDAVGAARAVLAVAERQEDLPPSDYRRALVEGLERFIADGGRVASLSLASPSSSTGGTARPRRRWRDRQAEESGNERGGTGRARRQKPDGQIKTRL